MTDQRPPMWIGHTHMAVNDVAAAKNFLLALGMRDVLPDRDDFAILEIRAGTHIIVEAAEEPVAEGTPAAFDLMVDDIEAMHAELTSKGLSPSALESVTGLAADSHEVSGALSSERISDTDLSKGLYDDALTRVE